MTVKFSNLIPSWYVIRNTIRVAIIRKAEMGFSVGPKIRFKGYLILAVVIFLVAAMSAGCSGEKADSGKNNGSEYITAAEFKILQKARIKLGDIIYEIGPALGPSTLSMRLRNVSNVLKKYFGSVPEETIAIPLDFKTAEEKKVGDTLGYKLTTLENIESPAKYAAQRYVQAFRMLYCLEDFEKYIAEHTLDEGAKYNPANPIINEEMYTSGILGYGWWPGTGGESWGNIVVRTAVDPNGAMLYYRASADDPRATPVPLIDIETTFISKAQDLISDGDSIVVKETRL